MDLSKSIFLKKELQNKLLQIINDNSEIEFHSKWPDFSQYFQNLPFFYFINSIEKKNMLRYMPLSDQ